MLQKKLAKRLKARYDTKMDGNEWMKVSSGGIPLCRIKYNGHFLSNADQNISDEYRSKIADIQDEISTVRKYVGLCEHAPQMQAADVSDYRQLAAFGDTVLAATYSEKNGFMFCTWKQNADGDSVFRGDYSPNYEYVKELQNNYNRKERQITLSRRSIRWNRFDLCRSKTALFSLLWGKKCGFCAKPRKKQLRNRQVYAII
jgi:GH43 family beta-xylosidase